MHKASQPANSICRWTIEANDALPELQWLGRFTRRFLLLCDSTQIQVRSADTARYRQFGRTKIKTVRESSVSHCACRRGRARRNALRDELHPSARGDETTPRETPVARPRAR